MSPSQKSDRALLGVPPERNFAQSPSRRSGQSFLLILPGPQSFSESFSPAWRLPDSSRPVQRGFRSKLARNRNPDPLPAAQRPRSVRASDSSRRLQSPSVPPTSPYRARQRVSH